MVQIQYVFYYLKLAQTNWSTDIRYKKFDLKCTKLITKFTKLAFALRMVEYDLPILYQQFSAVKDSQF